VLNDEYITYLITSNLPDDVGDGDWRNLSALDAVLPAPRAYRREQE